MQIKGHLILKDYKLSISQQNSLAVSITYILNLKYINIENCGLKDLEASYIVEACKKLPKI
jgi:hypothetical protein